LRERQAKAQADTAQAEQRATEARQAIERLRERQTREAKAQAEALQAQQQDVEKRLAALRARFGIGGTGGGVGIGGDGGVGSGTLSQLQRIRLQAYQELVREKIIDAWILPMPQEEARKLQATALMMVSREGQVAHLELLQPSGHPLFDESLLRAIKRAAPLPPLPEDYTGAFLEVEMRFKARQS
jgi:TonB family protein